MATVAPETSGATVTATVTATTATTVASGHSSSARPSSMARGLHVLSTPLRLVARAQPSALGAHTEPSRTLQNVSLQLPARVDDRWQHALSSSAATAAAAPGLGKKDRTVALILCPHDTLDAPHSLVEVDDEGGLWNIA
jgi:hypothetical protein